MLPRDQGFTLVELMFVVIIVGILATIAVIAFTKNVKKAHAAEVPQMFGELKSREDMYHSEFGNYLPVCDSAGGVPAGADCSEGDGYWPSPLPGEGDIMVATNPPSRWKTLKVVIPTAGLYCQYEVVAGPAGIDTPMGATGKTLFVDNVGAYKTPTRNWFYVLARCDWDSDPTAYNEFWQRDDLSELGSKNEGM